MTDGGQAINLESLGLGTGRRKLPLPRAEITRELEAADLLRVGTEEAGIQPIQIKELRQTHHTIARLLATGEKQVNVSVICGVSQAWISTLKRDPTFMELLQTYLDMEGQAHEVATADMQKRLAALGFDSMEVLHQRLLDSPEAFSLRDLRATAELALDRSGHGKTSTVNMNAQHNIGAETLALIRSSRDAPAQVTEEDRGALLGLALRATEQHPEGEAGAGSESPGSGLREESLEGVFTIAPGPSSEGVD